MSSLPEPVFIPPRAPRAGDWEAMTPEGRARLIEALPASMTESELSPPEGDDHLMAKFQAHDELTRFFRGSGQRAYVGMELTVYYPDEPRCAPDLMVVFDVEDHRRQKWVVSAEGKGLDFVLEVHVGGSRKKDTVRNVVFYAHLGIPEYFILDCRRQLLLAYRLPENGGEYERIVPQYGRYSSRVLGLDLLLVGGRLTFHQGATQVLGTATLLEQVQGVCDDLVRRRGEDEQALQEETRLREEETRLREEETRLREEETRRREAAERRIAELEQLLRERG